MAIALAMLVALFGAGYAVSELLFAGAPSPDPVAHVSATSPPPAPAADAAPARDLGVEVTAVEGRAEFAVSPEPWHPVEVGARLPVDAVVRTDADARVDLLVGERAQVVIRQTTELTVGEVSQSVSRLQVARGRISADVGDGAPPLRVEFGADGPVVQTANGEFAALSQGGQVAVATSRGAVDLTARGKTVIVGAGQQSLVVGDREPSQPTDIPPSFYLKVTPARRRVQRDTQTTVRGTASPGAIVSVNGVHGRADAEGQFEIRVPLRDGRNRLKVVARDALGREAESSAGAVTVDSRPPTTKTEVEW